MQFALLISVIVAVLLSAFLLLTHVQSIFRVKSNELIKGTVLSNQQLFKSLEDSKILSDTLITTEGSKTFKLTSEYYGSWTKTISEVEVHNRKITKSAFVGSSLEKETPNLYLTNTNSPLVVVGNTRLEGNSYLPKQGVKAGNISGNYYQGSSLYYGRAIESKESLPTLNPQWLSYIESITKGSLLQEKNIIPLDDDIKNTFYKPTKIVYNPAPIHLGNEKITGNVIIQSATRIIVSSASQLENVILIAPTIVVKDNVKGTMQLIATKKMVIGKRCYLSYPSSAVLIDQNKIQNTNQGNSAQHREPLFTIASKSIIEGALVYLKKKTEGQDRIKTHIKVEPDAEIIGEIYCQGNIDFLGTVQGSLYTRQFIASQSGSVYLNHLYNGKVLLNPIPKYAGLPFTNSKNSIAKWLY